MGVVVVGVGGIGSNLVEPLAQTLEFGGGRERVLRLVDGDNFEPKNRNRQRAIAYANKALVTRDDLAKKFRKLVITAHPLFLDSKNIATTVRDGDTVFSCVDNHATRKLLSEYFGTLKSGLLISGGNDITDGNIQIYERSKGIDVTPPLTHLHPEILNPRDKNPAELSCLELQTREGGEQILAVNFMIAAMMLSAYVARLRNDGLSYTECFYDMQEGRIRPVRR